MKMKPETFEALRAAINAHGGLAAGATMRERWDMLFACGFDVSSLYKQGLDDAHIDTALRKIASEK